MRRFKQMISSQNSLLAKQPSTDQVLISIVTVVFNAVGTIERTLRSIDAQDHPAIERIIIDGGSTDGTMEILERWRARIQVLQSGPDGGIYDAMNRGLSRCSGQLICMMNADDWFAGPSVLSAVANAYVQASQDAPNQQANQLVIYGDFLMWVPWAGVVLRRRATAGTRFGMRMNHQSLFIHREVHARVGGYDLKCKLAADFDLVVRMEKSGVRFVHLPQLVAVFAKGGSGDLNWLRFMFQVAAVLRNHHGIGAQFIFLLSALRKVIGRIVLGCVTSLPIAGLDRWMFKWVMKAKNDVEVRKPWFESMPHSSSAGP